jgi:bla regulator protein blaR1
MGYSALIGVLVGLAALALDYALRVNGKPTRSVWALAMGVTLVTPATLAWMRSGSNDATTPPAVGQSDGLAALLSLNEWMVTPTPFLQQMDTPLLLLWIAISSMAALLLAGGVLHLRKRRRSWCHDRVDDTDVLLSDNFGPALVGLTRPEIVLPRWTLGLTPSERAMVIAHESEHLATRDTQLLASGVLAALLMPWNLPLLWHLRRLRRSVEMDCDARVLRHDISPVAYGALLLRVGTNRMSPAPFAATLTEPKALLERRIQMITKVETQGRVKKTMMALALAVVVTAVACDAPAPTQLPEQSQEASRIEIGGPPTSLKPLIVVDGVITDLKLVDLDPLDIARIEVVKGAAANELYGPRGADGVIKITTKPNAGGTEVRH